METLADSIGAFGATLFRWSALAFVIVNGLAVAAVVVTRSRDVVNRWTSRLVAVNLLLLTTGVGVPAVAQAMKMVVQAVSASRSTEVRLNSK
jgi:hypothetical protein